MACPSCRRIRRSFGVAATVACCVIALLALNRQFGNYCVQLPDSTSLVQVYEPVPSHVPPRRSENGAPPPGAILQDSAFNQLQGGRPTVYHMRRKCIVGTFQEDWGHFAHLIVNTTWPFALARYGDGERLLIHGQQVSQSSQAFTEDKFYFDGGDSDLGRDLKWSLKGHYGQHYYYAFASPIDDAEGMKWYVQNTEQTCHFITYANLWVNSNYVHTKPLIEWLLASQLHRVAIIANYESVRRLYEQHLIPADTRTMELPNDAAYAFTGEVRAALIRNATALAMGTTGFTFIVSGGPMAKVLISHMWNANPANQYVDFGSSVDEVFKGRRTRPYMSPGTHYAQQVDPPFTIDDVGRSVTVGYSG